MAIYFVLGAVTSKIKERRRKIKKKKKRSIQHPTPPMPINKRPIVYTEDGAIVKADEVGNLIEWNRGPVSIREGHVRMASRSHDSEGGGRAVDSVEILSVDGSRGRLDGMGVGRSEV